MFAHSEFHGQRNAVAPVIDFLDHDADMLVQVYYLVGVSHILVGQLRDVHQTVLVDADVDEGTEIGDVGDDAG